MYISVFLKIIGWLTIVGGVLVFGNAFEYTYGGDIQVVTGIAGIVSGALVLGFAAVIDLLANIRDSLAAKNDEIPSAMSAAGEE